RSCGRDRSGGRHRDVRSRLFRQDPQRATRQVSAPRTPRSLWRLFQLLLVRCGPQAERKGWPAGLRQGRRTGHGKVRAEVKPFVERNHVAVGAVGVALTAAAVLAVLNFGHLPLLNSKAEYSAYFAEAGGLTSGAAVQVSGYQVGSVTDVALDGA